MGKAKGRDYFIKPKGSHLHNEGRKYLIGHIELDSVALLSIAKFQSYKIGTINSFFPPYNTVRALYRLELEAFARLERITF